MSQKSVSMNSTNKQSKTTRQLAPFPQTWLECWPQIGGAEKHRRIARHNGCMDTRLKRGSRLGHTSAGKHDRDSPDTLAREYREGLH